MTDSGIYFPWGYIFQQAANVCLLSNLEWVRGSQGGRNRSIKIPWILIPFPVASHVLRLCTLGLFTRTWHCSRCTRIAFLQHSSLSVHDNSTNMDPISAISFAASIASLLAIAKSLVKQLGPSSHGKQELNKMIRVLIALKR
jgi:hypothetical protein